MNNKLAVSLVLATTTLAGTAFAKGALPSYDFDPDPKPQLIENKEFLDTLMKTEAGQKMLKIIHAEEPRLDEMDPGARCDDIKASKEFSWPVYSAELAGFGVKFGVAADIGIVADSTRLAAEASFGPSLRFLGQTAKPIELRLSASTNNMGQNSVDLKLLAFSYELDSYNIASSTSPLEYVTSVAWSLPNALSISTGGTFDCSFVPLFTACSASWSVNPVVASVGGIFVLRVNSHGVEAHALAAASAHSSVNISGNATVEVDNPFDEDDEPVTVTFSAGGTGAINFMNANYSGNATLAPYNGRWIASADSWISVEDVLGAKASAVFDLSDIDHSPERVTIFENPPMHYHDTWTYQCSFDKDFK